MLKTNDITIRSKLSIYLVPLVLAIFLGNEIYGNFQSISKLEKNLEVITEQVAKRLQQSLDKPLWDMDEKAVRATLEAEMVQQDIAGIIVTTGQSNVVRIGKGRDNSWKVVDVKAIGAQDTLQREGEISHDGKILGKVIVYCSRQFVLAERQRLILGTMLSSILMAIAVTVAIFLMVTRILRKNMAALSAEAERLERAVQNGQLSERADPAVVGPEFRGVVAGMNLITEAFGAPLRRTIRFVLVMADGKVPPKEETAAHGEFEELRQASNALADAFQMRNADSNLLIQSALDGKLGVRADTSKYRGDNGQLIARMNEMLDAVAKPMEVASGYMGRIARGEIPERIREEWKGDFNGLRNSLNQCIDALSGLLADIARTSTEHAGGEMDAVVEVKRFQGAYATLAEGINHGFRMYVLIVQEILGVLGAYAEGDFEPVLRQLPGKQARATEQLARVRRNLRDFSADIQTLANAAMEGKLSARADPARYAGDWKKLVEGINGTLDAVVAPIKSGADAIGRIARGDIPSRLTAGWKGDFATLESSLNTCIDSLSELVAQMTTMARAQAAGDLDAYMAEERFVGVYRELAAGVNGGVRLHVQNLLKILGIVASYGDGDFKPVLEKLPGKQVVANERLDLLRRNLLQVATEIRGLSEAAVQGRLAARADPGKFKGDWAALAQGLNDTLEAILAPVHEASQVLEKLARRDLRARVQGHYQGDHAVLAGAVNTTAQALNGAMVQVAESADQVSAASQQVASSSQAVAGGASQQASSIEQTSASLESMASMTKQAADNAHQANTLAQGAKGAAAEGTAAMEQMQGAMGKIRASAESTSEIIKDINEIAFQTNLLALNAAVEAARAGEAGRGFAVVAEEVRSLALRSKEAANRTEALIRQSVKETEEGATTSKHVNDKLGEIARSITKVSDIVAEIAASAKEQAVGIGQATRAVAEMDKVTQQNAASAQESNSAAQELSSQADALAAMVRTFQLRLRAEEGRALPASPRSRELGGAQTASGASG